MSNDPTKHIKDHISLALGAIAAQHGMTREELNQVAYEFLKTRHTDSERRALALEAHKDTDKS